MLWLSYRQFRAQAAAGLLLTAASLGYLLYFGLALRTQQQSVLEHCRPTGSCTSELAQFAAQHENPLLFLATGLYLVPVTIGMFWGAPLISTELENGTHRFIWNQGVTRTGWLLGRLAVPAATAVLLTGALSAAMTWATSPVDQIANDKFSAILFGARDLAPVGYALLAVTLGALTGAVTRRRLPAMAAFAAIFLALLFAFPNLVRPHLLPVERESRPMTAPAINAARSMGSITGAARVGGLQVPNAWVSSTSDLLTSNGTPLSTREFNRCYSNAPDTGAEGTFGDVAVCLAKLDLHVDIEYQPNSRYWAFQLMELLAFAGAAGVAAASAARYLRHRIT